MSEPDAPKTNQEFVDQLLTRMLERVEVDARKAAGRYQKEHPILSFLDRWPRFWRWRVFVCPVLVSNITRTADFWPRLWRLWRSMHCARCGRSFGLEGACIFERFYRMMDIPPDHEIPSICGSCSGSASFHEKLLASRGGPVKKDVSEERDSTDSFPPQAAS
jgi:hypothetical protein